MFCLQAAKVLSSGLTYSHSPFPFSPGALSGLAVSKTTLEKSLDPTFSPTTSPLNHHLSPQYHHIRHHERLEETQRYGDARKLFQCCSNATNAGSVAIWATSYSFAIPVDGTITSIAEGHQLSSIELQLHCDVTQGIA